VQIIKRLFILLGILLIGIAFRFLNLNWDLGHHLHPDERFLTMVMNDMTVPNSVGEYLDPARSTFNPANVKYTFFVYGMFPLVLNKMIALELSNNNFDGLTIQGRYLSAIADTIVIILVFLIVWVFQKKHKFSSQVKYVAAFIYAICVLPIQLAHFFTTDTFMNVFAMTSLFFAVWFSYKPHVYKAVLAGGFLGLSLACKISAVYMTPLLGWYFFEPYFYEVLHHFQHKMNWRKLLIQPFFFIGIAIIFVCGAYVVMRLGHPYYFEHQSFFDLKINTNFINNINQLKSFSSLDVYFPPGVQWVSKQRLAFPLINFATIGLGLPIFFFTVFGLLSIVKSSLKKALTHLGLFALIGWCVLFFLYQAIQFVSTMRYFIFLYPLAAFFCAYGLVHISNRLQQTKIAKAYLILTQVFVLPLLFVWPLFFISIYMYPNTRYEASVWIQEHIPEQSSILVEHWDDALPLGVSKNNPKLNKVYQVKQIPMFYADTESKWQEVEAAFAESEYYILSSQRAWGSISAVPEHYPITSKFYEELLAGEEEFELIADFRSYPSLKYLGIPIEFPDVWAEEAFSVYDHPPVMVFRKKVEY